MSCTVQYLSVWILAYLSEKKHKTFLWLLSLFLRNTDKTLIYYRWLKGHKGDFPQGRLKTGSGEQCLWVLDRLADEALKAKSFAWKRLVTLTLFLIHTLYVQAI